MMADNYMRPVPSDHAHLWNDLPIEERKRLIPYHIEFQILTIEQMRSELVLRHQQHLRQIDQWINNLKQQLREESPDAR